MKNHQTLNEKWLQAVIAEDPFILDIGDVVLIDKERSHIHVGGGYLDLLFQEADGHGRYEVEIQLGATDPSHIIRTIEYWDVERKRYPQYEHTAVIVAEDITSRFLNVISLFNGTIPIIALQVTAIEQTNGVGLLFTKVLDTVKFGYMEDDVAAAAPADRAYWENKGAKKTVKMADDILEIIKAFPLSAELNYNKYYIGLIVDSRVNNFAMFRPQRNTLRLELRLPQSEETEKIFTDVNLLPNYDKLGYYKLNIATKDISSKKEVLKHLLKKAYGSQT